MKAPSLLAQCLPGLIACDRGCLNISTVSERDLHLFCPAVEIIPSKMIHDYKYTGENVDLPGMNVFKGKVSVADIIGLGSSEMICAKSEGNSRSWDSSVDLVNVLKHEIRDGQLSFRGKRVLEFSCSYGISGIYACLKGASTVHFQDINAETVRSTTIPNVFANLKQARNRQSHQPESPLTPSRDIISPTVHFYAGDWEELQTVLSVVQSEGLDSGLEEDFIDRSVPREDQECSSRKLSKLSGSRAWEKADTDSGDGYDVILMTEIPCSLCSLKKLYGLIKKCLKPPYGVLYFGTKKNYVGLNSGTRQLRSLVDEEGTFGVHLVKEITSEREIWKFFLK